MAVEMFSLFPLDVGSIHSTTGDEFGVGVISIVWIFVPSNSWNVLRVTRDSAAVLLNLGARELEDANGTEIITGSDSCSIGVGINSIDVSSISSSWENTHNFPTEFTSRSIPNGWITQTC